MKNLNLEEKAFYCGLLKSARMAAHNDSENFDGIITAIEQLGIKELKVQNGLGAYEGRFVSCIRDYHQAISPYSSHVFHTPVKELFNAVREARNDAVHQGALARHLTANAICLSLYIEEYLMSEQQLVSAFMVRTVVTAEEWQPLSLVRQIMLMNSFSYLPVKLAQGSWSTISDLAIAGFLREQNGNRDKRLGMTITEATLAGLKSETAAIVLPTARVGDVLATMNERLTLVMSEGNLQGVISAFDLL